MEAKILEIREIVFVKTKSEKVVIRADVHFKGFTLKGFKVLRDEAKFYVTPPSYKAPQGWRELFRTDYPEDWQEISQRILADFRQFEMKEAADQLKEPEDNTQSYR